jgi:tetratricopeptide (TPR) repeat protein
VVKEQDKKEEKPIIQGVIEKPKDMMQAVATIDLSTVSIEKPEEQEKPDYSQISKKISELSALPDKEHILNELLEKYNEDITINYLVAVEYHKLGKMEKAEQLYRKILEKNKDDKRVLYSLASIMNQQKKPKEAYELYKRIMAIAPEYLNTKKYFEMLDTVYGEQKHSEMPK